MPKKISLTGRQGHKKELQREKNAEIRYLQSTFSRAKKGMVIIMLKRINSPEDLKALSSEQLQALAAEIREEILTTVSKNGGHLASNLGTVELSLALHTVFDCPKDSFVFDVGHQCYTHKLITGRAEKFGSLRQYGGISGFTCREESEYDMVTAGHSGTSVSTALGIAEGKALRGDDSYTVAVLGDGSFTNGMIHEALNCCSGRKVRLIIVLNDNGMSISKNVGGLSDYLSRIRTSEKYFSFKCFMKNSVGKLPFAGKYIVSISKSIRNFLKRMLISANIFESLGLRYLGPVNGGDIDRLISVFDEAKTHDECTVVHVRTTKGLGYAPAEEHPERYHSVSPFDPAEGVSSLPVEPKEKESCGSFTDAVALELCGMAEKDDKLCAVCAAMPTGTGLDSFCGRYPERFFDAGIAEEHAITFSAGLAAAGFRPVCVMYSTFAQRIYDQLWHDAALQSLPVKLLLSHAGLVPGDGVTHQGIFDVALFSPIPGVRIFSPDSYNELRELMREAIASPHVDIIRYPKGEEAAYDRSRYSGSEYMYTRDTEGADAVIVTYGRLTAVADAAADAMQAAGRHTGVLRLSCIEPVDTNALHSAVHGARVVYFLEEGIRRGSVGERLEAALAERGYRGKVAVHAIDGEFVPHGSTKELMERCGFTPDEVVRRITALADEA